MKMTLLAAAAVLSLAAGSAYAATAAQNSGARTNNSAASGTSVTAVTNSTPYLLEVAPVPNPWDGTESWQQWNKDHPMDMGGN